MKHTYRSVILRALSCALALLLLPLTCLLPATAEISPFSGTAAGIYDDLIARGFPEDYAKALTELCLLHPNWEFTPLTVTEEEPTYTWSYVIAEENKSPDNNIISSSDTYAAYHHPTNRELYDASHYQVSDEALAYFMDPRNFLNETDVFQFLDLSTTEGINAPAIEAVLAGTFMENALLENGKTYAEYFLEVGTTLAVNPIFLAVKARQEQGVNGTSPIISGTCGDLLDEFYRNNVQTGESGLLVLAPSEGHTSEELLALNGYYNLYNVGASGNGVFSIYRNAMLRAQTGSAAMEAEWGSPAWDTVWKSLYGGASVIKNSYVSDYKNTIYLQKFNVDSRASGNFWRQYMQNVTGAFYEARTFYTSFASTGMLDSACRFLIPVYGEMPATPSPDPAEGSCAYLLAADLKYTHNHSILAPMPATGENTVSYLRAVAAPLGVLPLSLDVTHSYGVTALEYAWNGSADWTRLSDGGTAEGEIPIPTAPDTTQTLTVRGIADYDHTVSAKKNNSTFLVAVISVDLLTEGTVTVTLHDGDREITYAAVAGTDFPLPSLSEEGFVGWLAEDGGLLPAGATVQPFENVTYRSLTPRTEQLEGAALIPGKSSSLLRFFAAIDVESLAALRATDATVSAYATVTADGETLLATALTREQFTALGTDWQMLVADTAPIPNEHAERSHTARFYLSVTYADGTVNLIPVKETTEDTRSVREVALAALADTEAGYSPALIDLLTSLSTPQP